jgi:hypothetical protein
MSSPEIVTPDEETTTTDTKAAHARQPSISEQSRIRSTSFRAGISPTNPGPTSPTLASPTAEAADIYRRQAARIDELEKQNKKLEAENDRLRLMEEELQELRESAALKDRTSEADGLKTQVAALQRLNAQLQAAASKSHRRRESAAAGSPVDAAHLDSRAATIEALELEISALNARVAAQQAANDEHVRGKAALEARLREAQDAAAAAAAAVQDALSEPKPKADSAPAEGSADLAADLAAARARADALDRKAAALTALHRDTAARRAADVAEAERLRAELARLRRRQREREASGAPVHDDDALDELEDEERGRLERRVRELEEEVFDLRRGAWRQRRKSLQPGLDDDKYHDGLDDDAAGGFDDVDLSPVTSSAAPARAAPQQHGGRTSSSIADVINSGISAFAGGGAAAIPAGAAGRPRGQSIGLLDDDDFDFDEDGFRRAQEEEQAARIERVKETKRGLKKWEGWRMDIVHLRVAWGGVFEV